MVNSDYDTAIKKLSDKVNKLTNNVKTQPIQNISLIYKLVPIIVVVILFVSRPYLIMYENNDNETNISIMDLLIYTIIFSVLIYFILFIYAYKRA